MGAMRTTLVAAFLIVFSGAGAGVAQQPMATPTPGMAPAPAPLAPTAVITPLTPGTVESVCGEPVILNDCSTNS